MPCLPSFPSLALCLALAGTLLAGVDARAAGVSPLEATAEQKQEATLHFVAGKQAFDSGDLNKAASELTASLAVVNSPNAHLQLARALRDSGRLADAWTEYRRAAEGAAALAPKEERYIKTGEAAAAERSDLQRRLALVVVTVTNAPEDAMLKLGGRVVLRADWASPVVVPAGAVEVALWAADGAELSRFTVQATVGQTVAVSMDGSPKADMAPEAATTASGPPSSTDDDKPSAEPVPAPMPEPSTGKPALRPLAYVAGGLGAAGLATFAVFGLMSSSTYNDLKANCPRGCPPDKHGEIDSGILQQTVANVGLGVGLVGIAAGATMFVLSMPPKKSSTALVVSPGYLGVRGTL